MYKITCCRKGKYFNRQNKGCEGCFTKEFKTLSEIAKFVKESHQNLFYPNLRKEITRKEMFILSDKLDSLIKT